MALRVILERTEERITEPLVKRSRLKAEGGELRAGASALNRILFGAPHLRAVTLAAKRLLHRQDADVQSLRPDHAEQSAENFTFVRLYEERDRIPLIVPGDRDSRSQRRTICGLVVSTSLGSQVAHGLTGRNVDRFRGHAQVRGGQWRATDDRDLSAGESRRRLRTHDFRRGMLQVGFSEDLMPATVPCVRTNCQRLPRRIRGESLQGFRPAAVRLCRMSSATVLYTRERNCQRGSAAQVV